MESKNPVGRPRKKWKKVQIYFSVHPFLEDDLSLKNEIKCRRIFLEKRAHINSDKFFTRIDDKTI
jgi:hypothetical protein